MPQVEALAPPVALETGSSQRAEAFEGFQQPEEGFVIVQEY